MDLKAYQRRERLKAYLSIVLAFIAVVCLLILWTMEDGQTPDDEVSQCVGVVNDASSYEDKDVEYCRNLLKDIIKRKSIITT